MEKDCHTRCAPHEDRGGLLVAEAFIKPPLTHQHRARLHPISPYSVNTIIGIIAIIAYCLVIKRPHYSTHVHQFEQHLQYDIYLEEKHGI